MDKYELTVEEQRHVSDVKAQISAIEEEMLKIKGVLFDKQNDAALLRRHLSLRMGEIAAAHGMPVGSVLRADGKTLAKG